MPNDVRSSFQQRRPSVQRARRAELEAKKVKVKNERRRKALVVMMAALIEKMEVVVELGPLYGDEKITLSVLNGFGFVYVSSMTNVHV